eukprot:TRINITY_DN1004_c0_g1_i3.p1 TRINITY_DN1004_c0_g1~~TRINITY_DN1004_c0_g1_i3.p1  ORF type:complete len:192 (+),score=38.39 TRINITY_DN1004_c0_g1_i3:276-851(+)
MLAFSSSFSSMFCLLFLGLLLPMVPAPVPRCSPFIIINKLAEFSNVLSDSNPYFPVPPCEYGGPRTALKHGDFEAVFVFARPELIPRHNFYELVWLMKYGAGRLGRIISGEQEFISDGNILNEGYSHYTPYVRTHQIGTNTYRNPIVINDKRLYNKVVGNRLRWLFNGKGEGGGQQQHHHHSYPQQSHHHK